MAHKVRSTRAFEGAIDAAHGVPVGALDLGGVELGRRRELWPRGWATGHMHAVQEQGVEVEVERQGRAEALDGVDGAVGEIEQSGTRFGRRRGGALVPILEDRSSPSTISGPDGTDERARHLAQGTRFSRTSPEACNSRTGSRSPGDAHAAGHVVSTIAPEFNLSEENAKRLCVVRGRRGVEVAVPGLEVPEVSGGGAHECG